MVNYTRDEIEAYAEAYLARQKAENTEYNAETDPAARSALEEKFRRTAKREFVFNKYVNHEIDEEKMQPRELQDLAKDFGYGKGMVGFAPIEDFAYPEYNTIVSNQNNAMLSRLDELPEDAAAEEILREAPFINMLADACFSLDQDDQKMIETFKKRVDTFFTELDKQKEQADTATPPSPKTPKKTKMSDREIGLNGEEFNLLRNLTDRSQALSGGELLHKAVEVSNQIAQKYEERRRYDLGMEVSAAFLKRFAVSAIRYKKINQWRLNDLDKQLLLEFLTHPVKARHLPEEQVEQVKNWVMEAIEGRKKSTKDKAPQKETGDNPQTAPKVLKKKTAAIGVISMDIPQPKTVEKENITGENEEDEQTIKDAAPADQKQEISVKPAVEKLSVVVEKNFRQEKVVFKRKEDSENESELAYDLYPAGKNPEEAQPSGKVIFRKPNDAILISEEFPHYLSVVKTLRDNGCDKLKVGNLSDDEEKNQRFKAALVLAGATLGMPVEGLNTAEKLEELKAVNPQIELLIEKRKFNQEMKALRQQFETARQAGEDTAAIEQQIQEKIAAGVQKYIEKGSIDPQNATDKDKRRQRIEAMQAKPGKVQDTLLQKALSNLKSK